MSEKQAPPPPPAVFHAKRTALRVGGIALATLSFQALGIIYSDLGTSPLYVLNGLWPASGPLPPPEDVVGGISAIVWSLTILPLLKYIFISLHFGTREGEGGSFALFQGLYPAAEVDFDMDRSLTGESSGRRSWQTSALNSKRTFKDRIRFPLLLWSLFGTALTMADGILTPAVSITSAVGGIAVAKPSVAKDIVPISIAFIVVIFFVQQFGTGKLAFSFSPVAALWFLLLAGTGIYNITFYPAIFRAFDPSRAVMLFVRTKDFNLLAGILLAITGCEAIFANLGQFNAASIRISFCFFVYPSLILAYLGQGARLISDGEAVLSNIFYQTIPGPVNGPLYWIMFIFAILATLIASQALITATFSLTQQVVNLKSLPPIRMVYTSDTIQGQVYIPLVNWVLMFATIIIVAAFKNLENLTNAYGFAVATVMLSTTGLLAIQMYYVKRWPVVAGALFFLVFGFFDTLFWGASLKKVPHGAWVPLMLGSIMAMTMTLWTWGKRLEDKFDGANRMNLRHFIGLEPSSEKPSRRDSRSGSISEEDAGAYLTREFYFIDNSEDSEATTANGVKWDKEIAQERKSLATIPVCAVFYKITRGQGVPHTFVGFLRQWPALPRVTIFLSVCTVPVARVSAEDRYIVEKVKPLEGIYGVTYYLGFREECDVKVAELVEKIIQVEQRVNPDAETIIEEIRAVARHSTHIAPHYVVLAKKIEGGFAMRVISFIRKFLIEDVYRRFATMFPETANWLTSSDKIIHVGITAVI